MVSNFEGKDITKEEFESDIPELDRWKGIQILFAAYTYECYEGDAFVLFKKDGKLWEVNGGHCSCYGLEGQWEPEETTIEAIEVRLSPHMSYGILVRFSQEIRAALQKARTSSIDSD